MEAELKFYSYAIVGYFLSMAKRKLKIGDIVRVTGYRPGKYAPGVVDEMGTEDLFKSMVGKRYRVCGFDQYGHIELRPKRLDTVWIEADLLELAGSQPRNFKKTQRAPQRPVHHPKGRTQSASRT